jgi:hypothetical protein
LSASAAAPIDALIGYPVFAAYIVEVNYPQRTIRFMSPGDRYSCSDPIAIDTSRRVPVVEVTVWPSPSEAPQTLHLIVDA